MQETFNGSAPRLHANGLEVIQSYYQLTKPRIILLLLITTAAGSLVASRGQVDGLLLLSTLVGGALASGAANTINCLYDRDIDYIMERTRWRPLPSGRIQPRDALLFAIALTAISFTLLATVANLLAASLAMAGIVFYVLIYTHWLKRHTTQNIVIGGAAGAIPPLVGWAAVTGDLTLAPWLMFLIICLWTPPHFWALALMIRDDYKNVGLPMLPVVEGSGETTRQILLYSFLLVPVTLVLSFPGQSNGLLYGLMALGLGIELLRRAIALWMQPEEKSVAKALFTYSIFYLMLLSAAMVVDVLPALQGINNGLMNQAQAVLHAIPMVQALS